MDYAKEYTGSFRLLEQRWYSVRTQGEIEDCPCLHMVVNLEGKKPEDALKTSNPFPKIKMNCLALFTFGTFMNTLKKQRIF